MNLLKMLGAWSQQMARNRREKMRLIDIEILWPACLDLIGDIEQARRAFLIHALSDENWTLDLSDAEIVAEVDKLKK